jgi:hypothetical protein
MATNETIIWKTHGGSRVPPVKVILSPGRDSASGVLLLLIRRTYGAIHTTRILILVLVWADHTLSI